MSEETVKLALKMGMISLMATDEESREDFIAKFGIERIQEIHTETASYGSLRVEDIFFEALENE